MPKVITVMDLQNKKRDSLQDIYNGNEDYIFVANGTYPARAFFIVRPDFFINVTHDVKPEASAFGMEVVKLLKEKVSEKYRKIRLKRWQKKSN